MTEKSETTNNCESAADAQIYTLKSADDPYRVIVEEMSQGALTVDATGMILFCNRCFAGMVEHAAENITGTRLADWLAPDDRARWQMMLRAHSNPPAHEFTLLANGNQRIPVCLTLSPFQLDVDVPRMASVLVTDLREQKRNESIVAAEKLARAILDQAGEAIVVCDPRGTIIRANAEAVKLAGASPLGQLFDDVFSLADVAGANLNLADLQTHPTPIDATYRRNGSLFNLAMTTGALTDENAAPLAYVITLSDITARKQMEDAMASSLLRLQAHADNSPLAIIQFDADYRIIDWSQGAERIFGWTNDEVLGKHIQDLRWVYEEDIANVVQVSHEMLSRKRWRVVHRNRNYRKDGTLIHCVWYNSALLDANGKLQSVYSQILDDTSRVVAEAELLKSEKRFELLSEANALLLTSQTPEATIQTIAAKVMRYLDCDVFFNYVINQASGVLELNAFAGISAEHVAPIRELAQGQAICGCVARDGAGIVSEDVQYNGDERAALVRSMGVQAYASYPLKIGAQTIGTLSFGTRTRRHFTNDELALMRTVADQVSVAIERKRAEEQLRASEERFRVLTDAMPQIVWATDANGNTLFLNQRAREFGITPDLPNATQIWQRTIHPDDLPLVLRAWTQSLETGAPFQIEHRLRRLDGQYAWHLSRALPQRDDAGNIAQWIGTSTDIEGERRILQTLRESEERYRRLFENLQEAFALCEVIPDELGNPFDLRYVEVNPAMELALGKPHTEIIGKTYRALIPAADERVIAQVGRVGLTRAPLRIEYCDEPTQRWFQILAYAPRPGQVATLALDITERKNAETEIRRVNERFANVLNNFVDRVFIYDADWRILFVNDAGLDYIDLAREKVVGRVLWELFPRLKSTSTAQELFKTMQERQARMWSAPSALNGHWQEYRSIPWEDGVAVFIRDIHDRRIAEERVAYQNNLLALVSDAIIAFDENWRITFWNPAAEQMYGIPSAHTIGKTLHQTIHALFPASHPLTPERQERLARGENVEGAFQALDENGNVFWAEYRSHAFEKGVRPAGYVAVHRDITLRKHTEEELRRRAEEVELLMNLSPVAIFLAHDPECRRITGNPAGYQLVNVSPNHNISKSAPPDEQPSYRVFRAGVEIPPSDLPMQKAARLGIQVVEENLKLIFDDGSHRYLYAFAAPLFDVLGKPRGAIAAMMDISVHGETELLNQALNLLNQKIHATRDINAIFELALEQAARALGCANAAISIRENEQWHVRHTWGGENLPVGTGLSDAQAPHALLALRTDQILAIGDAWHDPRVNRAYLRQWHVRAVLVLPLLSAEGAPGVIFFNYHRPMDFQERHLDFARKLAATLELALENANLFENLGIELQARQEVERALRANRDELEQIIAVRTLELKQANDQLFDLSRNVIANQEEERRRVSQELHDEAGQALTALKMSLQIIRNNYANDAAQLEQKLNEAMRLTDETIERIRLLAQGLRPPALESAGLDITLEGLCVEFARRTRVDIAYTGEALPPMNYQTTISLYRFVQEALTNAVRHGHAAKICVRLQRDAENISLTVEDNGAGLDPQAVFAGGRTGLGLLGMQERLRMVNGWLEISSTPNAGARLTAHVPLEDA